MATRKYIYYELTNSICSTCLIKVEAKVVFENGNVYLHKHCFEHGFEKVLVSTDIEYYKLCRDFNKPGDLPKKFNTKIAKGCPYDCGLCPDHEQHSCVTLVEITDRCNLQCPTCYAESGPDHGRHRTVEEVEWMLDKVVANEGEPDVVQISGGEPTIHPDFFKILDIAKTKPIRHLMINTNGLEIAQNEGFAEKLAKYKPGFEVYLQFDSFDNDVIKRIRGAHLLELKYKAIEKLNELNISTTLVCTVQNGYNSKEIGKIIDFALKQRCVRGVTFQPTQVAGRLEHFDPSKDRITLGEVRQQILKQSPIFTPQDLVPVPCHPDAIMMGYALKLNDQVIPLTRYFDPESLLSTSRNTMNFEQLPEIRKKIYEVFSTGSSPRKAVDSLKSVFCCLPKLDVPHLTYENMFRVIIMQFLDIYNFDVRSVKKSCVHIVHKDGRIIPFDTMNIFYRNNQIDKILSKKGA
ncbi:MAG: radical SAM protein [Proteobacteria bacterium]|nr:radical SAM protein [Pseudomonadota bacterium]